MLEYIFNTFSNNFFYLKLKDFVHDLRKDFVFTEADRVLTQIRAEIRRKAKQVKSAKSTNKQSAIRKSISFNTY